MFKRLRHLSAEFTQYFISGGMAFAVDFGILTLLTEHGFHYLIGTTAGFCGGLVTNYLFCILWVWRGSQATRLRDLITFTIIGVLGLLWTDAGMWFGVEQLNLDYQLTKVIVAGLVLFWNFTLKRWLVFKPLTSL